MNVVRAMSSEGWGRIEYHGTIRKLLDTDVGVRGFMEGETDRLPEFYSRRIEHDLGPLYQHLPAGAMMHDPNAYLKSTDAGTVTLTRPEPARRAARLEHERETALESARDGGRAVAPAPGSF
jgi:hypothetical protein